MEDYEFEVKLIELVQCHKLIYDKKVDGYRNRNEKNRVWKEIALLLETTVENANSTWSKIRQQYLAFKRKLKKPSGSAGGCRPYFRHESSLQFLNDLIEADCNISNDAGDFENETGETGPMDDSSLGDLVDNVEVSSCQAMPPVKRTPDHRPHQSFAGMKKRKLDPVDEEVLRLLSKTEDECSAFGNLVATKLRQIKEADRKLYVETEYFIQTMLHEAEMKLLNTDSS